MNHKETKNIFSSSIIEVSYLICVFVSLNGLDGCKDDLTFLLICRCFCLRSFLDPQTHTPSFFETLLWISVRRTSNFSSVMNPTKHFMMKPESFFNFKASQQGYCLCLHACMFFFFYSPSSYHHSSLQRLEPFASVDSRECQSDVENKSGGS